MPSAFDASNPPFDRLTQEEIGELRAALDIAYLRPGEAVLIPGQKSEHLHVVIKGSIEVRDGGTLNAVLGPKDAFDSRALVHGAAGEDFIATEETLCYLIPRGVVLNLISRNAGFAAFFYSEVSAKLDAFARAHRQEGMESVLRARVREASRGPAVMVPGDATLAEAAARMQEASINAAYVREDGRIGVVTGMNLAKAVLLKQLPLDTPVRQVCHFDVIAVDAEDFIFEALLLMTRHDRRRVAVRTAGEFTGFLEDIHILGLVAGNSQLIPGRIDRARNVADLAAPAQDIQGQVERLHRQGVKVEQIAEITSDLNRRLFVKLFDLLAPPAIRKHGCLMIMGSEGRGEQTVRTDQDNGLLLDGPVPAAELTRFRQDFSGALADFGFPPCPGDVMVRNPLWSQPLDGLLRQLRLWIMDRTPEAAMNLAIFFDAVAVTGRTSLLAEAKHALAEMMRGERALIARFANLVESFETPGLGAFSALMEKVGVAADAIDIKKAGIFPIVHGMRAMAMDRGIMATSTAGRIEALVAAGAFSAAFGQELLSALRVFMEYRLRAQLEAVRRGVLETEALVLPGSLSPADRDILRDALRIVRQFRETLRSRYNLAAFG
ncbi:cyclic nucleotide-binding domain-containing protein [Dankookia rubra]|uniref:Cyclic nucleotide-binding domain-containing protein n=1 Tax=Dankookia rubra TaxID=1442381 RepID=A0A4R5QLL7_9PROT|nr:putative nucleotidyltransferase substrate binding domain-containing protein [Dankookia rubra]TDH64414.1 cyclic nucleotide-binding domain-containing protein [Dankookia rubra]